jgi:riboflavin synthase
VFTGIVEELGEVVEVAAGPVARLTVRGPLVSGDARPGDSIAVNGVCLTVVSVDGGYFSVDVMKETFDRSALGGLSAGDPVNLERAATLATRLGGHLVQGHVDAVGEVLSHRNEGDSLVVTFSLPADLRAFFIEKGSVAIDGISLTVNSVGVDRFSVQLIPETQERTTLRAKAVGERVNLEADMIGKYVARLVSLRQGPGSGLSEAVIKAAGFGG